MSFKLSCLQFLRTTLPVVRTTALQLEARWGWTRRADHQATEVAKWLSQYRPGNSPLNKHSYKPNPPIVIGPFARSFNTRPIMSQFPPHIAGDFMVRWSRTRALWRAPDWSNCCRRACRSKYCYFNKYMAAEDHY